VLSAAAPLLVLLLIWEVAAVRLERPWLFPPVTRVLAQLAHPLRVHYASGSLLSNTLISLLRVLIGFVLAAAVGIVGGLLMGSMGFLRRTVEPVVEILRPLCPIAWLPFAIAAEMMIGSDSGIGYLLMYASDNAAMDLVVAAMFIIGGVGALLNYSMRGVMRHFVSWKGKEV
jgi:ABC-type nitrate/sulfonate/bicarbonate transport system permease component